jgi:hypothetical protein
MKQDVFGDLQVETACGQAGAGKGARDRLCKVARLQLLW